jgi:ketosteroid isomerase-like protein
MNTTARILLTAGFALAAGGARAGQATAKHPPNHEARMSHSHARTIFAPFDAWWAAVLHGDAGALAKFYSTNPAAKARIGQADSADPNEEAQFWGDVKADGMMALNPKILEFTRPAADKAELVMRVEGEVETAAGSPQSAVASLDQVWQHQPGGWRIVETQRSNFVPGAVRRLPQPEHTNPNLYPPPGEAEAELHAALSRARRAHKRVLVVFGANWCYDCHVLDTTFHSPAFAPLVNANYEVVHINVGDEGKDNAAMAARIGVVLTHGIPSLAVLNPDGSVVVAQKNGEFESTVKIGPEDVRAFLEKWKPQRSR